MFFFNPLEMYLEDDAAENAEKDRFQLLIYNLLPKTLVTEFKGLPVYRMTGLLESKGIVGGGFLTHTPGKLKEYKTLDEAYADASPCILIDDVFDTFPKLCREFILNHEYGHFKFNHNERAVRGEYKIEAGVIMSVLVEQEADSYSCRILGLDEKERNYNLGIILKALYNKFKKIDPKLQLSGVARSLKPRMTYKIPEDFKLPE